LKRGYEVTAVVRSEEKLPAFSRAGVTSVVCENLLDAKAVRRTLVSHDAVVNLATHIPASAARMLLPRAWRENDRVRKGASRVLTEAASELGVPRFVQESFAYTYPSRGADWVDETAPLKPAHFNATVLDAERSVERFVKRGGVGVVLRFAAFYGPDSRLLGDMIHMVERGVAPILGPENAFISSVAHDDAATAVVTALELPAGTYNVGDDQPVTHREFADTLAEALGVKHPKLPPEWLTFLAGPVARTMARSLRLSNRKLETFGWKPKYRSVRDGFPDAVGAFKPGRGAAVERPAI
jgi:nucleoside-diphosphate-sugar epimerase